MCIGARPMAAARQPLRAGFCRGVPPSRPIAGVNGFTGSVMEWAVLLNGSGVAMACVNALVH